MTRASILASTLLLGMIAPLTGAAAAPQPPTGFTLTWADDFDRPAGTGADTSAWKYSTGCCFGTGQIATMTTSTANVYHDGQGHLVIKAIKDRTRWTSGRIETQRSDFGAAPGGVMRVQASLQQPDLTTANGLGYWPGFWMLGAGYRTGGTWPDVGEIDIMEDVNGLSKVWGTLHCGVYPGGPCNEPNGIGSGGVTCTGCQTSYRTYAVEVDRSKAPEEIRWYLDGTQFFTVKATQVDATTWARAVDHPFFILFDLYIGGDFPNGVCGCTTPNRTTTVSGGMLKIDYVAVYNKP